MVPPPSTIVLDCSICMSWCLKDEKNLSEHTLRHVARHGAIVPSLWWVEMENTMLMAERRKRCTAEDIDTWHTMIDDLLIATDSLSAHETSRRALKIAQKHNLTVYDATYLELAIRMELPLATLDTDLQKTAAEAGIKVFAD